MLRAKDPKLLQLLRCPRIIAESHVISMSIASIPLSTDGNVGGYAMEDSNVEVFDI
jgi:hypothetical protein